MEHNFAFLARWRDAMQRVAYIRIGRLLVLVSSAHQIVTNFSCFAQIGLDYRKIKFLLLFTTFTSFFDIFFNICKRLNYSNVLFPSINSALYFGIYIWFRIYLKNYFINEKKNDKFLQEGIYALGWISKWTFGIKHNKYCMPAWTCVSFIFSFILNKNINNAYNVPVFH